MIDSPDGDSPGEIHMPHDTAFAIVAYQIACVTGIDASNLRRDTRIDDLPLDSLQAIELVVALEDAFDISIGCAERITIETLGGYADLAEGKTSARIPMAA